MCADMKEGEVSMVFAKPEYSFQAPCKMEKPKQLPEGVTTETELRLLHVEPGTNVCPSLPHSTFATLPVFQLLHRMDAVVTARVCI